MSHCDDRPAASNMEGDVEPWVPPSVVAVLAGIVPDEAMPRWWVTPIPAWNGTTPQQMWQTNPHRVIGLAEGYHDPPAYT